MELKEGMYVRTKEGNIEKICAIENEHIYTDEDYLSWYPSSNAISKASYNIIDLIEVGDVISTNNLCGQVTSIEGDKIYTTCYDGECCYDYQIQSIVTKEQFSKMEYKID